MVDASAFEQMHDSRPTHVTASPDVAVDDVEHQHEGGKRWNLESPDGGSDKHIKWKKEKGGGPAATIGAFAFISLIASLPVVLAWSYKYVTKTHVFESALLYVWLLGGLYLFTQVLIFQSPHFEEPRTLSVEEAIYLFAQILTTVGYGDITPARPRGQLFVGLFVLLSVLLIANMVTELLEFFENIMQRRLELLPAHEDEDPSEAHKLKLAFEPVLTTSILFCGFVLLGTAFFTLYPGENKTPAQGIYMSLITLSTVGFGAFTPTTHAGMVFGAFWMVFGCASLVAVITSRGAFSLALKHYEIKMMEEEVRESARRESARRASARMASLPAGTKQQQQKQAAKEARQKMRAATALP